MKPKAYFFDLDGTSYYHKYHDVMPSTLEAWKQLKAKGYYVAIATSRCYKELLNFRDEIRSFPFDALITDGGACVRTHESILLKRPISKKSMECIHSYCKKHQLIYRYATADGDYYSNPAPDEVKEVYFRLYLSVPEVKPYSEEDEVFNVLLYLPNSQMQKELCEQLVDCAFTDHQSVLEVTDQTSNKITGIHWLCDYLQISPQETMAFGDGFNDVEMIKDAGIGVAMGNGVDACKEVADHVCGRIEEDGIYNLLKELEII